MKYSRHWLKRIIYQEIKAKNGAGMAERSNAPDLKQVNACLKGDTQKDREQSGLSANAGSNPAPRNKAKNGRENEV